MYYIYACMHLTFQCYLASLRQASKPLNFKNLKKNALEDLPSIPETSDEDSDADKNKKAKAADLSSAQQDCERIIDVATTCGCWGTSWHVGLSDSCKSPVGVQQIQQVWRCSPNALLEATRLDVKPRERDQEQ